MSKDAKLIIGLIVLIVLAGVWQIYMKWSKKDLDSQVVIAPDSLISFSCEEGKTLTFGVKNGIALVKLSDGREFTLEETVSASGERYSNEGDAVVFWNKGESALVEELGVVTHANCVKEDSVSSSEYTTPVVPLTPLQEVESMLVGKWRNSVSQNQIFNIKAEHALQESFLTSTGAFMVPQSTWRVEKAVGAEEAFDPQNPAGAALFIRTGEDGKVTRFEVKTVTLDRIELYNLNRESALTLIRVVKETEE